MNLFSEEFRRNPYPVYAHLREVSPLFREPQSGLYMIFDYDGVKRVLNDPATFSSRCDHDWMIFADPPRHTKLRGLVSRAFTPRVIAALEPRIRELARGYLDAVIDGGEMDMALDFSAPLAMTVIAQMLGIPAEDWTKFRDWSEAILNMSYTIPGGAAAGPALASYRAAAAEMDAYLRIVLAERRNHPGEDLLSGLQNAELDGERLTHEEILGFFQLLLVAGQETTTNLINNAILCFMENPGELARLRANPGLLPSAIEEVLRYRSPLHWMFRVGTRDVEVHGQSVPAGKILLAMIGAANRDARQFVEPDRFDITRDPNPHIAFGYGIHFCLGAVLSRLEARTALTEFLERVDTFEPATPDPWVPRNALHVHGPTRLPIRFTAAQRATTAA